MAVTFFGLNLKTLQILYHRGHIIQPPLPGPRSSQGLLPHRCGRCRLSLTVPTSSSRRERHKQMEPGDDFKKVKQYRGGDRHGSGDTGQCSVRSDYGRGSGSNVFHSKPLCFVSSYKAGDCPEGAMEMVECHAGQVALCPLFREYSGMYIYRRPCCSVVAVCFGISLDTFGPYCMDGLCRICHEVYQSESAV